MGQARKWETAQDGLDRLMCTDCQIPQAGKDEVLVEILAVSLDYRDTEVIQGLYNHHKSIGTATVVPCASMCGRVAALGGGEQNMWKVGDRVMSIFNQTHLTGRVKQSDMASGLGLPLDGVMQTHRVFPLTGLVKTPDYLTDEEASTLPIAAVTAWMSITGPRAIGDPSGYDITILLQGTGGVAIAGLQIAHAAGAKVIITSSSDKKLAHAKTLGASDTINYRTTPDWHHAVMRITNNVGADIILETGGAQTLRKSLDCVAFGGEIACIGYLSGKQDEPQDRTNVNVLALRRNLTLQGILNGPRDRFEEMLRFYQAKQIRPVVDMVFSFDEAKEALQYLMDGKHFGKVVVRISP